ncbi:MAG TPA: bifunctional ornithine acetyltransferase/N-acetylglutamate synthase, partial [Nevskia sp.]|nr:bifunctional ornithine acetyltransferase/N-acetylglutamate synthase [Nevskia sp.]
AEVPLKGGEVQIAGMTKGSGMIHPNMATTLGFVMTDAAISPIHLREMLVRAVNRSYNRLSVDGDTSTNDSCVLLATAQAGREDIGPQHADFEPVCDAVTAVCIELAQAIARDGEGATRFITIEVDGAHSVDEARKVGYSIAHSPLVKTAMFAGDANWGRIVMAIGKAGVEGLDPRGVAVALDQVPLIERGEPHPSYREELGAAVVAKPEFSIRVSLGRGAARARLWTCDFSYDYVKINAEYRT